jgi:Spy/CpxP family protein refolding chaperone
VGEPSRLSGKKVWVARPNSSESGEQILPVDFAAITHGGSAATNYQIMPGDRVFIAEEMNTVQTAPDKSDAKDARSEGVFEMEGGSMQLPENDDDFPAIPGITASARPQTIAELKLTDEQKKSLRALRAKWMEFERKNQEEMRKYGKDNPPPKEAAQNFEKNFRILMETIRKEAQALLTPEQRQILTEARMIEGAGWFLADSEWLKKGGITDLTEDQRKRISDLQKQMIAKTEESQKETKLKIAFLFDKEQRAKLRDVLLAPEMNDSGREDLFPREKEKDNLLIPTMRPYPDFSLPETQKALNLTESQLNLVQEILDGSKNLSEKLACEMDKLPPEQQKKIDNAQMGTLTISTASFYAMSGESKPSEEEIVREDMKQRKAMWEDWLKQPINKLSVEYRKKFEASLTPDQLEKFKEMAFDNIHYFQLNNPAVLHLAGASKEQKDAIRQTIGLSERSNQEGRLETGKEMLKVLTSPQKKKFGEAVDAFETRIESAPLESGNSGVIEMDSAK